MMLKLFLMPEKSYKIDIKMPTAHVRDRFVDLPPTRYPCDTNHQPYILRLFIIPSPRHFNFKRPP